MNKKRIFLIAVAICCLALAATGTLAFFTARDTAYNVITTGELAMDLIETTTDGLPYPEEPITNVVPSMVIDKKVTVKNVGGVDFYARIALTTTITDANGATDTLTDEYILLDLNETEWIMQGDYYYYYRALLPGEETEPLFTTVTFAPEMPNAYQKATIEIDVAAEAVQSRNNTDSPLTAAGWGSN